VAIAQTYSYAHTNFGPFISMNCIIFISKTPQILRIQFRLLRNS